MMSFHFFPSFSIFLFYSPNSVQKKKNVFFFFFAILESLGGNKFQYVVNGEIVSSTNQKKKRICNRFQQHFKNGFTYFQYYLLNIFDLFLFFTLIQVEQKKGFVI